MVKYLWMMWYSVVLMCLALVVSVWVRSPSVTDILGYSINNTQLGTRAIAIISAPDGLSFGTEFVYGLRHDSGFYYATVAPPLPHMVEWQWVPIRFDAWEDEYSSGRDLIIRHWLVVSALAMLLAIPMLGRWWRRTSRMRRKNRNRPDKAEVI